MPENVSHLIFVIFCACVIFQVLFALLSLRLLLLPTKSRTTVHFGEFVSVIVAAHNEASNLPNLISSLAKQKYLGDFEIIIVDDRSTDATQSILRNWQSKEPRLNVLRVDKIPEGMNSKKWALMQGINQAKSEFLVFTDADCQPASVYWLQTMMQGFQAKKSVILGFSPYFKEKSILNRFIQYETFYTALQYFTFAVWGLPYMGVGRNLAYRKSLFTKHQGFAQHAKTTGGDDDLLIGRIATSKNISICLNPQAYTFSVPKKYWREWFRQKKRHLSVGRYYAILPKVLLGVLHTSHLGFWLSTVYYLFTYQDLNYQNLWQILIIIRILLMFLIYSVLSRYWKSQVYLGLILFFDFIFVFYIFITGVISSLTKKISWD